MIHPVIVGVGDPGDLTGNLRKFSPVVPDYLQTDARLSYSIPTPVATSAPAAVTDPMGGPVRQTILPTQRWYHGVTLTIGCNNIFNQQPPFIIGANGNTDLSTYDPYGRLVYFQVSKNF